MRSLAFSVKELHSQTCSCHKQRRYCDSKALVAESEEGLLHKIMGVLLLPLGRTIKKFMFTSDTSIYSFFPQEKINVIAASFLTLQFEYFRADRPGCLLDLWYGSLMNISMDVIKHDFSKTQNRKSIFKSISLFTHLARFMRSHFDTH